MNFPREFSDRNNEYHVSILRYKLKAEKKIVIIVKWKLKWLTSQSKALKFLDYRIFLDNETWITILKMENSKYQMKDFMEIPETHKSQSIHRMSSGGNHDDFFDYNFNASDESFNSNSSSSSKSSSSEKKNDVNYDLLRGGRGSKGSEQSFNEIDSHNKPEHHKSFVSIVKFFKSSVKSKTTHCQHQSILRQPTEYGYVRGISGLPIRVIKSSSPSSASCLRIVKR